MNLKTQNNSDDHNLNYSENTGNNSHSLKTLLKDYVPNNKDAFTFVRKLIQHVDFKTFLNTLINVHSQRLNCTLIH